MTQSSRIAFLFLAAGALFATGCSPAQQVVGKWEADIGKAMGGNSETSNPLVAAMITLNQVSIKVEFEGNGTYTRTVSGGGKSASQKGSWRYVKMDEKALVLMVKEAGKTDEMELRFTLTDADHAEMSMPSMATPGLPDSMSFVRVKPAS
jgi:hypothetical protein